MVGLRLHRRVEQDDVAVPFGVGVNIGAVTVAGAGFVAATLPASRAVLRLGVLVFAVGAFAAWAADAAMAASVCVIAFLLLNSFLVNTRGELSWHGTADGWRLGALALASGVGCWVGWVRRYWAAYNKFADLEALANGEPLPEVPVSLGLHEFARGYCRALASGRASARPASVSSSNEGVARCRIWCSCC